ncbi:MAG: Hsp20/alpha crystallin family protein [Ardenticatenaceae bacterium]|nr:Hsp20/alpha crystallin family protein [Anaerolineales bacterium]MCB8916492.1 Hsp20/alpha crystallin family protein [Ardenticatenaceae bacterium]
MIRMKVMTQTPDWTEQTTPDTSHTGRRLFSPRVDIYEVADGLVLLADLPGVDESAVEVTVENQVLTLRGRVAEPALAEARPVYREYRSGDYFRRFSLANTIDTNAIEAQLQDGLLQISLPHRAAVKPQRIQVQSAT